MSLRNLGQSEPFSSVLSHMVHYTTAIKVNLICLKSLQKSICTWISENLYCIYIFFALYNSTLNI